jgi:hypothetical protein
MIFCEDNVQFAIYIDFKCLLGVEADPPSVVVEDPSSVGATGISSRVTCTSDEFIPTQPTRFTAATSTRISSSQLGTVRGVKVEEEGTFIMMFLDGT